MIRPEWWEYGIPNDDPIAPKPWTPPPLHYALTEETWKRDRPKGWSRIPFQITKKYGWYISVIGSDDYLIMPVFRGRKMMLYSARRLTNNGGPKYKYPPVGTGGKYVWISGRLGKVVMVAEGVADAAYLSLLGSSIALLGSFVSEEAVSLLKGKTAVLLFDGDLPGRKATMMAQMPFLSGGVYTKPVFLPEDKDPTDLSLNEIAKMVKKQTEVEL